jgi:hypothetical protein
MSTNATEVIGSHRGTMSGASALPSRRPDPVPRRPPSRRPDPVSRRPAPPFAATGAVGRAAEAARPVVDPGRFADAVRFAGDAGRFADAARLALDAALPGPE